MTNLSIEERYNTIYNKKREEGFNGWLSDKDNEDVKNWFRNLLKITAVKTGDLLEIGCGAGNISQLLTMMGYSVIGIDISKRAIEWAIKKNIKGKFIHGNVSNLGFIASSSIDIVVDSLCLHCLIEGDRAKAISEIHRVLKEKGDFLVVSMCGNPRGEKLIPHFNPNTRYVEFDGIPECYFGRVEDILNELRSVNFEIVSHQGIDGDDKTGDQDMLLAVCRK